MYERRAINRPLSGACIPEDALLLLSNECDSGALEWKRRMTHCLLASRHINSPTGAARSFPLPLSLAKCSLGRKHDRIEYENAYTGLHLIITILKKLPQCGTSWKKNVFVAIDNGGHCFPNVSTGQWRACVPPPLIARPSARNERER